MNYMNFKIYKGLISKQNHDIIGAWESDPNARPPQFIQERSSILSPISESQRKAVRKYNAKSYDRLEITVTKGRKAELQEHAQQHGESLNGFVNRAIDEAVERDSQQEGED